MLLLFIYVFVAGFIGIYCILYNAVKVKIGCPPIGILFIAYKYFLFNRQRSFQFIETLNFSLRTHKLVKLYYFRSSDKHSELAEGIILSENGKLPDGNAYREAQNAGLTMMITPAISHAISIEFPVFLCFPLTKLFAVLIGYPKINRISKKNNLCAYPIIEIYSMKSISFIVPLVQQDSFVVHEAEKLVFGKSYYENGFEIDYRYINLKKYDMILYEQHLTSSKNLKSPKLHKRITKG